MNLWCLFGFHNWENKSAKAIGDDLVRIKKQCKGCSTKKTKVTNDAGAMVLAIAMNLSQKDGMCLEHNPSPRAMYLRRI